MEVKLRGSVRLEREGLVQADVLTIEMGGYGDGFHGLVYA